MERVTAWGKYIPVVATGLPFWEQAITRMAELTELDDTKAEAHHSAAKGAFMLMNDWYFDKRPYVKARRNEIDSAISFIRNAALRQNVANRPAAASARNLAGVLRILLHLATRNYRPEQYSHLMTSGLLNIAAAKSLFPADMSDLVAQFAKADEPPSDNIAHMAGILQRAASHHHLEKALGRLDQTLDELWSHIDHPEAWSLPDSAWKPQPTSLLADIHNQSVQDFHKK